MFFSATATERLTRLSSYNADEYPFTITTADFTGDGKLDLAVTDFDSAKISFLLEMEMARPRRTSKYHCSTVSPGPVGLETGDFNGDGLPVLRALFWRPNQRNPAPRSGGRRAQEKVSRKWSFSHPWLAANTAAKASERPPKKSEESPRSDCDTWISCYSSHGAYVWMRQADTLSHPRIMCADSKSCKFPHAKDSDPRCAGSQRPCERRALHPRYD